MNSTPHPIRKADPRLRRRAFFLFAVFGLVGVIGLSLIQEFLRETEALRFRSPEEARKRITLLLKIVTGITVVSVSGFGIFLGRFSLRVMRIQQFPPPGTRVRQDTPFLTGSAAQRRGRVLLLCSAGLIGSAILLTVFAWKIVHVFSR